MLSKYIADTFGKEYSSEWIRQMLIKLGFSYKRGQYMPIKGDLEPQEAFKKAANLLDIIENTSDTVLYVQDETKIRVKFNNYRSWSSIREPPAIERNGSRKGVNIIGATEISRTLIQL